MPNYQEGKIYKIYNTINDDIYVGSTTQKLCERMREHRSSSNDKYKKHYPIYKEFSEHGVENFFIELIEKCPCNDKDELRRTEGKYIRGLKPSLNMLIAGRGPKERYVDNKEMFKQYYNDNKEHALQKAKDRYEKNKEQVLEHRKQYKEHNKEYIREEITCECGCTVTREHLPRHKRSAKQQKLMAE